MEKTVVKHKKLTKKSQPKLSKTVVPTQPKKKKITGMGTAELGLASFELHNRIQQIQNGANKAIAEIRGELAAIGTELEKRQSKELKNG